MGLFDQEDGQEKKNWFEKNNIENPSFTEDALYNMKDTDVFLVFQKGDIYPRQVLMDSKTNELRLSKPIENANNLAPEPKKPGLFKRIMHSIFGSYKQEINDYNKAKTKHDNMSAEYKKVENSISTRKAENAARQASIRNSNNNSLADDRFTRSNINTELNKINIIADNSPEKIAKQVDEFNKKHFAFMTNNMKETGSLNIFGKYEVQIESAGLSSYLEKGKAEYDPIAASDIRRAMANLCVYYAVKAEKMTNQSSEPGPLESRLNKEAKVLGGAERKCIPMVKELMDNPTFQEQTKHIGADDIYNFVVNDGPRKMNNLIAKSFQKEKAQEELQSQKVLQNNVQEEKTANQQQPEHIKMGGPI